MVKKVACLFFALFLSLSLYVNWKLISMFEDNEFHNLVPTWNEREHQILRDGYKALVAADYVPVGIYPYEIIEGDAGITIRFRTLEHLQVGSGPLMYSRIDDGCVYYHFDTDMNLIDLTSCG